jgi:hypothetical protein
MYIYTKRDVLEENQNIGVLFDSDERRKTHVFCRNIKSLYANAYLKEEKQSNSLIAFFFEMRV